MAGPLNGSAQGVIIPTMIQTSADLLNYISSLTCVYDVQWVPEYGRITLPISMFQLTSIHEIGKTNVSTKRVILYEPQSKVSAVEMSKIVRPSVLRAITDNAVRDPKAYNLEFVLPFSPIDRSMTQFMDMASSAMSIFSSLLGLEDFNSAFNQYLGAGYQYSIAAIAKAANILGQLPDSGDMLYINKNSLDSMWERTHLLCMKMWTGFDYKYVMITNLDISKKPLEDDVFRGSMQVQEMPVLCVNRPDNAKVKNVLAVPISNVLAAPISKALSDILVAITGVGAETGVSLGASGSAFGG